MSRKLVPLAAGLAALALPGTALGKCPNDAACPFTSVRTAVSGQPLLEIAADDGGFVYGVTGTEAIYVFGPNGNRTRTIAMANVENAAAIDVSANGAVIAVADVGDRPKVVTFEGPSGTPIHTYGAGLLQAPSDVTLMPGNDPDPVVTDRATGSVVRFDADDTQVVGQYAPPGLAARGIAASPTPTPVLRVGTLAAGNSRPLLFQLRPDNMQRSTSGITLPSDASTYSVAADEVGNAFTIDNVTDTLLAFGPGDEFVNAWGSWGTPTTSFQDPLSIDVANGVLYVSEPNIGPPTVFAFTLANDAVAALPRTVAALNGAGRPAVTVACRARGLRTCPVRITLRAGNRRVGGASMTLAAGAQRAVALSVAADVIRRLRLGRDVQVSAEVRTRRPGRRDRVHSRTLRLLGEDRR